MMTARSSNDGKDSSNNSDEAGRFSNQVNHALSQLSSKFGVSMNQAFATVPATKERAAEFSKQSWSPLAAYRKRQLLKENQEAIEKDMQILHQTTKVQGAAAIEAKFEGFAKLGQDDYVESLLNELDNSDFDSDSDSDDESDSEIECSSREVETLASNTRPQVTIAAPVLQTEGVQDVVKQAQQQLADSLLADTTHEVSESEDENPAHSDADSEYDSEEDSEVASDYDSEYDGSSYYDSDDESLGDLMAEIENELGFVLPDALLEGNNHRSCMSLSGRSVNSASNMSLDSYSPCVAAAVSS